jgi:hypothetical protein
LHVPDFPINLYLLVLSQNPSIVEVDSILLIVLFRS